MKIVVLDFCSAEADVITVSEEWLRNDLRNELDELFEDDEWERKTDEEIYDLFLFEYCGYNDSNIQYMIGCSAVNNMTPKDFR